MHAYAGTLSSGYCIIDTKHDVLIIMIPKRPPRPISEATQIGIREEVKKFEFWKGTKFYLQLFVSEDTLVGHLRNCISGKELDYKESRKIMEDFGFKKNEDTWKAKRIRIRTSYLDDEKDSYYMVFDARSDIGECNKSALQELNDSDELEKVGNTELHYAAADELEDVITFLERGYDINVRNNQGETPLDFAVLHEKKDIIHYLVSSGADVNASDNDGLTPLIDAIFVENDEIIQYLRDNGARVTAEDIENIKDANIALVVSIFLGDVKLTELSISKGADLNLEFGFGNLHTIHLAAQKNHTEIVRLLISKGADVNAETQYGVRPLFLAEEKEMVRFLIENGAKANKQVIERIGETRMQQYAYLGDLEKVKSIIFKDPDELNKRTSGGSTLLHFASRGGNLELVNYIIEKGGDIHIRNKKKDTILHLAVESDNKELVEYLILQGLDVDAKNSRGETPIYRAIDEIALLLVGKGADINLCTKNGYSILTVMALKLNKRTIRKIITEGIDVDAKDGHGNTALHTLVIASDTPEETHKAIEIAELLLSEGTNINATDADGNTPLHLAVREENYLLTKYLIQNGADIRIENNKGKTSRSLSDASENKAIISLLGAEDQD